MAEPDDAWPVEEGQTFKTFEEFDSYLSARSSHYREKWVKGFGCRTVENANKAIKNATLHFRLSFKYALVNYRCIHGGVCKSSATQRNKGSSKMGCPCMIQLTADRKLDELIVKKVELNHIHNLTPASCNLSNEQLHLMSTHSPTQLLEMVRSVVPPLQYSMHKGNAGRVAVIGGCKEYTGAPYFAAITALKVGADLSHVFCASDAATVIKSYSPELIVHPVLDKNNAVQEISQWLPRFHSLVIGPGLGRDEVLLQNTADVILKAKEQQLPLVIDADGLFLVTEDPAIISGYRHVILTPNIVEFGRLYKKVFGKDPDPDEPIICVKELCRYLGHVTIVQKGLHDIISNGEYVLVCSEPGSPRRCGGQGDLLSGSMGLFAFWSKKACEGGLQKSLLKTYGHNMCAAYAACALTRECNRRAFEQSGRSMTTTEMIAEIHQSFETLFS